MTCSCCAAGSLHDTLPSLLGAPNSALTVVTTVRAPRLRAQRRARLVDLSERRRVARRAPRTLRGGASNSSSATSRSWGVTMG